MDNIIYKTLEDYFDILSKYGNLNYAEVYKIVAFILLNEFNDSGMFDSLQSKDKILIERFIDKIQNSSCVIPNNINCAY